MGIGRGTERLGEDVRDLLSVEEGEGVAGSYANNLSTFTAFPTFWWEFMGDVDVVGRENEQKHLESEWAVWLLVESVLHDYIFDELDASTCACHGLEAS